MKGWTKSKGVPEGALLNARVQDLARPEVFHLGLFHPGAYLRSEDGGKTFDAPGAWSVEPFYSLALCASVPQRLYASTIKGVRRSDDFGKTWHRTAMRGFKPSRKLNGLWLFADPSDPARLFLIASGPPEVLWRSNDGGESWSRMDRGLSQRPTMTLMLTAPMLAVTKRGVKVALLGGGRQARIGPGEDRWQDATPRDSHVQLEWLVADPFSPSWLWRIGQKKLWRSDDGRRWQRVGEFEDAMMIYCDTGKSGRLVVTREENLAFSTDGGASWQTIEAPVGTFGAFAGENFLAFGRPGVFWKKIS